MTVWLVAPGILLAGSPLLLRALLRAAREAAATRASVRRLASDLALAGDGLHDATDTLQSSMTAFRERGTLRSRLMPGGDTPVA